MRLLVNSIKFSSTAIGFFSIFASIRVMNIFVFVERHKAYASARIEDRCRRQKVHRYINGQMNLTSSLVDLSCRWPGEEVRRSGKTELGREPGEESDLWKSPPPPPLERSPSRFCKPANFRLKRMISRNSEWKSGNRKKTRDRNLNLF